MKVVIFGASGFLGKALATHYLKEGAEVHLVSRKKIDIQGARFHPWDGKTVGTWVEVLENAHVVVNMAGKSVDCRYTPKNKSLIYNSRIESTAAIGKAISQCKYPPKLWFNASSATIYRHAMDRPQDEPTGELGTDFSPEICKAWEKALFDTTTPHTMKYALRTSMVFGEEGGILPRLHSMVKIGLGGRHGSGMQKVSWIHVDDFIGAIHYMLIHKLPEGIYNVCAPNPTDNATLMAHLRKKNNMPAAVPLSTWMLHLGALLLQTEVELLLKSRWVLPTKLLMAGFKFKYPTIHSF